MVETPSRSGAARQEAGTHDERWKAEGRASSGSRCSQSAEFNRACHAQSPLHRAEVKSIMRGADRPFHRCRLHIELEMIATSGIEGDRIPDLAGESARMGTSGDHNRPSLYLVRCGHDPHALLLAHARPLNVA